MPCQIDPSSQSSHGHPYQQSTAHNDQNSTALVAGLCVESGDLVLNLCEWKTLKLLYDLDLSLACGGFKCEHGVLLLRGMLVGRRSVV